MATAGIDAAPAVGMAAVGTTRSSGTATLGRPQQPWATPAGWRDGMMHLSDHDFIRWLDQQRQAFDDHIDRQIEEYRLTRDRVLAGG
jgi:hypothetical protein